MSRDRAAEPRIRRRISTLLLTVLAGIAGLVLLGLIVMSVRLFDIRADLAALRDTALPRLVKLAQLSQEASATSSIAPALSARPTRSEFETLLSRIKDKEISQQALIDELAALFHDPDSAGVLRRNGDLLIANLQALTDVVREQIVVTQRLERHGEALRALLRSSRTEDASDAATGGAAGARAETAPNGIGAQASSAVMRCLNTLLDPNRARFSRNKTETEAAMVHLAAALSADGGQPTDDRPSWPAIAQGLLRYWSAEKGRIYDDKSAELANAFKIKALVEENSLVANRMLGSANTEFWRASAELESQVRLVNETTRFTLISILVVVVAFAAGNYFVWSVLKRRVFKRLDRMRDALRAFAETRDRALADPVPDEIGDISAALSRYMTVIDEREAELAEKSNALEQLSNQLAKYLSPQVYDSIFSGKQEVTVTSSRKKLTIFFSDIAGFTETADRLESEELTQLLNHYLTEMSRIALDHGATIDKYVGDAILIFFGDPETRGVKQDALACVTMAIAMRKRMRELEDTWREAGIERPLRVRMGIHTEFCTVGNFGSEDRMDYTIVGGAVNIASRLEESAAPGEILISYETFAQVNDRIRCEERGEIEVKGIAYPLATYRVIDSYEELGRERRRFSERHAHLRLDLDLDAMTARDRAQASGLLRKALGLLDGDDGPARAPSEPRDGATRDAAAASKPGPTSDPRKPS